MKSETMRKFRRILPLVAATFAAAVALGGTFSLSSVSSRQRYPWNGLVDVDCEVVCDDAEADIQLAVVAKDNAAGTNLTVRRVWLESDATRAKWTVVKPGKHRLVWDAGADVPGTVLDSVTVSVRATKTPTPVTPVAAGGYLVIDLSGGPDATRYSVSYLDAEPQGGWTDEHKTTKLVLRLIQPGTFTMGSPSGEVGRYDGYSDEVQHQVTISKPFYMGVFQVTQRQYQLVTGETPSSSKGDKRPVERVSYDMIRGLADGAKWPASDGVDEKSFLGKLRARTGLAFDLPTEAQWEYACRAGTTTALNSGKNISNPSSSDANMNEVGRYGANQSDGKGGYSSAHTTVGSYRPNDWGLYDMHGNVYEWCLDWYGSLSSSAVTDPKGPSSGSSRGLRGGSWINYVQFCRSAHRSCDSPSSTNYIYGFRLCCPAGLQGSLPSGK